MPGCGCLDVGEVWVGCPSALSLPPPSREADPSQTFLYRSVVEPVGRQVLPSPFTRSCTKVPYAIPVVLARYALQLFSCCPLPSEQFLTADPRSSWITGSTGSTSFPQPSTAKYPCYVLQLAQLGLLTTAPGLVGAS